VRACTRASDENFNGTVGGGRPPSGGEKNNKKPEVYPEYAPMSGRSLDTSRGSARIRATITKCCLAEITSAAIRGSHLPGNRGERGMYARARAHARVRPRKVAFGIGECRKGNRNLDCLTRERLDESPRRVKLRRDSPPPSADWRIALFQARHIDRISGTVAHLPLAIPLHAAVNGAERDTRTRSVCSIYRACVIRALVRPSSVQGAEEGSRAR